MVTKYTFVPVITTTWNSKTASKTTAAKTVSTCSVWRRGGDESGLYFTGRNSRTPTTMRGTVTVATPHPRLLHAFSLQATHQRLDHRQHRVPHKQQLEQGSLQVAGLAPGRHDGGGREGANSVRAGRRRGWGQRRVAGDESHEEFKLVAELPRRGQATWSCARYLEKVTSLVGVPRDAFSEKELDEAATTSSTLIHSNVHETKSAESRSASSQNETKLKRRAENAQNASRVGNLKGESKIPRHRTKLNDGTAKSCKLEAKPKTRKEADETCKTSLLRKQNGAFKYDGYTLAYLAKQKKLSGITDSDSGAKNKTWCLL